VDPVTNLAQRSVVRSQRLLGALPHIDRMQDIAPYTISAA